MKICSKCNQGKDYEDFYKDKSAKDGYNRTCHLWRLVVHHEDYRKRLSIILLCKYCHEKLT